ncbi:MAG: hypothetical protein LAO18_15310 [Acidobacteriia bacterium]|nr:hypothetical protein [Terriglobia bacterium]
MQSVQKRTEYKIVSGNGADVEKAIHSLQHPPAGTKRVCKPILMTSVPGTSPTDGPRLFVLVECEVRTFKVGQ